MDMSMSMPMSNDTMMMMNNMGLMQMSFYWGKDVVILFKNWPNDNLGMYILALFFVFFLAAILELLSVITSEAKLAGISPVAGGLTQALVYALRMAMAYLVMLSVMSYNVGVFIAAVAGHAFGYFILKFSAIPQVDEIMIMH